MLIRYVLPVINLCFLLMYCGYGCASEEESNKNILKAEEKYNQRMAKVIDDAHSNAAKAKADLIKVMRRELSNSTKKGNFDEAMRLKKKLEVLEKEDRVTELFGDIKIKPKKDKLPMSSAKPIKLVSIWCGASVPAEKVQMVAEKIIDKKTNTATFVPKEVVAMLGSEQSSVSVNFMIGRRYLNIIGGNRINSAYRIIGDKPNMSEENFNIRHEVLLNDRVVMNYEIALKEYLKLSKEE